MIRGLRAKHMEKCLVPVNYSYSLTWQVSEDLAPLVGAGVQNSGHPLDGHDECLDSIICVW